MAGIEEIEGKFEMNEMRLIKLREALKAAQADYLEAMRTALATNNKQDKEIAERLGQVFSAARRNYENEKNNA